MFATGNNLSPIRSPEFAGQRGYFGVARGAGMGNRQRNVNPAPLHPDGASR